MEQDRLSQVLTSHLSPNLDFFTMHVNHLTLFAELLSLPVTLKDDV